MRSPTKKTSRTAIGMMVGSWIGAGMGVLLFAFTQNVLWIGLAGVGVALGLGIGAASERRRPDRLGDR
jgi:uncharacterized membrane protein YgaE (UPF0421/DUF939 family)